MLTILLLTIHKGDLRWCRQRIGDISRLLASVVRMLVLSSSNLMPPNRDRDRHERTDNRVNNIDQFIRQPVKF